MCCTIVQMKIRLIIIAIVCVYLLIGSSFYIYTIANVTPIDDSSKCVTNIPAGASSEELKKATNDFVACMNSFDIKELSATDKIRKYFDIEEFLLFTFAWPLLLILKARSG